MDNNEEEFLTCARYGLMLAEQMGDDFIRAPTQARSSLVGGSQRDRKSRQQCPSRDSRRAMTYEGIEFVIRAGLGRNEWTVTIHFPDASESLARSSVVKVTGTRDEAIVTAQKRIEGWLTRQQRKARAGSIVDSRRQRG
jgi:hypothetical protein